MLVSIINSSTNSFLIFNSDSPHRELRYNQIVRFPLNAFDELRELRSLRVDRNNVNCDCETRDLVERLAERKVQTHVVCASPNALRGRTIEELKEDDLKCEGKF